MKLHFEIVTAGVWQCVERPEIQVRKMPRERLGRNGFALPGWAVFVNGREILTCGREATKRHAVENAEGLVDREAEQRARMTVEAERQLEAGRQAERDAASLLRRSTHPLSTPATPDEVAHVERQLSELAEQQYDGSESAFTTAAEHAEREQRVVRYGDLPADATPTEHANALARRIVEVLSAAPVPADPATEDSVPELVDRIVRRAQWLALRAVLGVLDGWVEGAQSNAEAMDRRRPDADGVMFVRGDIRRMVNDAARELRVPEPYRPEADR